jgi:membrane-associated phospholipid phosphatase
VHGSIPGPDPVTVYEPLAMHRLRYKLRLALVWSCAALPLAAGSVGGQEHDRALGAAPDAAPCATFALGPQPCLLWHPEDDAPAMASVPLAEPWRFSPKTSGGAALAASFVAATLLDSQLRGFLAAEDSNDPAGISRLGNILGNGRIAFVVTGATYGVASLAEYDELADPAGRVLVSLVAAGIANGMLKASLGRARPRMERGPTEFRPFAMENGWQSFPSGHATTAFALATAISVEMDRPWVTALTFSGASLVAWSRGHEDQHWASDVVAGAAVGTIVAYHTSRRLHRRAEQRDAQAGVRLLVGPDVLGVALPVR